MNDLVKFLKENPIQYLATIGLDGRPKVRPMKFRIENDGKLYFATSNKKSVFKELEKSPYLDLSTSTNDFKWLRISGKAIFTDDLEIKKEIIDNYEDMKGIYKTADNPDLASFNIKGTAVISDLASGIPMKYDLY